MSKQEHFYRAMNIEDSDNINLIDRWILACLIKGIQGTSNISKISLEKISRYCRYTNDSGDAVNFGVRAVQASINNLESAGMIKVIKPNKKGQCTKYEIKDIASYEKINDDFFNLDLSPSAKGYILCMLQHNLNKDKDTHQPNEMFTKTTYNAAELSNKFHTSLSTIYRTEKALKDLGILTIENDPQNKRDQETGLIIQNRELDLQKVGLDVFVQIMANHEQRLRDLEQNEAENIRKLKEQIKRELILELTTPDAVITGYEN